MDDRAAFHARWARLRPPLRADKEVVGAGALVGERGDRARLARASGWSLDEIAEIDACAGSALVHSFPTRAQMLDGVPARIAGAHFVAAGRYRLALRCPILAAKRAR